MKFPRLTAPRSFWPVLLVVAVLAFALGRGGSPDTAGAPEATAAAASEPTLWTCSMHPQIILPSNDQKCPICFMDLIPLNVDQGAGLGPADLRLSTAAAALAEIRTAAVARRPVARSLRLVGKVSADETLERTITARFGGRLERLHVDATGETVRAGDPLADIYSPQLYAAQTELRTAAAAAADDPSAAATLEAAAGRLRLLGLDQRQVDAILAGRAAAEHLTVTAPLGGVVTRRVATAGAYVKTGDELYAIADLSRVWVRLHAFETDVPWLRTGQPVTLATRSWPGRGFAGTIAFIDPLLDQKTRSVEVRVAVDNADGALKPGMLASGQVEVALDAAGRAVAPGTRAAEPLVIPATAPLLTGTRAVVYVKLPGRDEPVFQGRQVELGPRAGDWYVVASGLEVGEEVVVEGAFKIDSALQIQAKPAMMSMPTGGADPVAAPRTRRRGRSAGARLLPAGGPGRCARGLPAPAGGPGRGRRHQGRGRGRRRVRPPGGHRLRRGAAAAGRRGLGRLAAPPGRGGPGRGLRRRHRRPAPGLRTPFGRAVDRAGALRHRPCPSGAPLPLPHGPGRRRRQLAAGRHGHRQSLLRRGHAALRQPDRRPGRGRRQRRGAVT